MAMDQLENGVAEINGGIVERYHDILEKYDDNHAEVDYWLFKAQQPTDMKIGRFRAGYYYTYWYVRTVGLQVLAIVAPVVVALFYLI
jgi:hypothetical protein